MEVNHIVLNYQSEKGETKALQDISFTLSEGDFLGIVGPSGCGKSTILNILAGLIKPSQGFVRFDDKIIGEKSSKAGYMLQKDSLFEWLSVEENAYLGLKIKHNFNPSSKSKVESLLKNYGLWDFRNHHPSELSGGMRQRVALIRTLALNPELLLLDEPFSALDYQTRLNVGDEIAGIIGKENKTAIIVTHDISEAISMAQRVLVFSKRPATIKNSFDINFPKEYNTPLKKREAKEFSFYFNSIWKLLNSD